MYVNKLEYALISINSVIGISITIEDFKNILGIIILSLQILLILWNLAKTIYHRIKTKEFDKVDDDIKDAIEKLKEKENNE